MAEKKEKTIKVEVLGIPVRHDGQDYEPGDTVEINEEQFNEEYFKKVEKE